jgi:uncharacterized protein (DUF433 family)
VSGRAHVSLFENLKAGSDIKEILEQFPVTREQVQAVLEFAARVLDGPPMPDGAFPLKPGC